MTEIIDNSDVIQAPPQDTPTYHVEFWPFVVAVFCGPLLSGLIAWVISPWMILLLIYGGPIYLVIGVPTALQHLRTNVGRTQDLIILALGAVLWLSVGVLFLGLVLSGMNGILIAAIFAAVAAICATLWAGTASLIYNWLRSDRSRHPA